MFKKIWSFLKKLALRPEVRQVVNTWERVFTEQRSILIAEMGAQAKPLIERLMFSDMTGSQKRDYVVTQLTNTFKGNLTTLKANITAETLKDIAILATQQQFVAQALDKK